ncbi:hypothetical protein COV24_03815 [candidate division WWE3 bacterium CG10_big_fil_rev_8_21_14_0_10_32_10]|uniref:Glycosyl transferase family 1 domain-containing protein n=1 Tax=candidate division WWE3 bacterium CG10_big_fil_rev_8_21_14_0_10_32_10 TaxID=1975090 RepID=A0A2H0RBN4_UNCKA|nr:MAG: hypothetical protein COV24_03815 [candidate division WWE3 bacterium CG10_big_fil_rev_8_21_14_0_10_32_10]
MDNDEIKNSVFIIVTHILFRDIYKPNEMVEGPYTSVARSLEGKAKKLITIGIPLIGYKHPIFYGEENKKKSINIPSFLGLIPPVKYAVDFFVSLFLLAKMNYGHIDNKKVVVGVDPLSTLPAIILKPIFKYKLIFYSVDFNETRFKNNIMQKAYELLDKWASIYADQVWVVCDSLKNYKKTHFKVDSLYIPNSPRFDSKLSKAGRPKRTGNKLAWTGTLITDRQYGILFEAIENILKIRPDLEVYLVPIRDHEKFQKTIDDRNLKNVKVEKLTSRRAWQEYVAKCDIGLAVYDDKFGSTKYIEPLKIWDFMLCGVPFIISCEPSISKPVIDAKVCYLLGPANTFMDNEGLKKFLEKKNLDSLFNKCTNLSKEYAIDKKIIKSLENL